MSSNEEAKRKEQVHRISKRYPSGSWALWSNQFPSDDCPEDNHEDFFEFLQSHVDQIRNDIVLLSLNRASQENDGLLNFHSTSANHFDDRLAQLVEESGLTGAYMTDLVLDETNPDSNQIEPSRQDVLEFLNQLNLLDQREYHVICFHEKVFRTLQSTLGGEETDLSHNIEKLNAKWNDVDLQIYRVWFYGNWGANKEKIPELKKQLAYLINEIE